MRESTRRRLAAELAQLREELDPARATVAELEERRAEAARSLERAIDRLDEARAALREWGEMVDDFERILAGATLEETHGADVPWRYFALSLAGTRGLILARAAIGGAIERAFGTDPPMIGAGLPRTITVVGWKRDDEAMGIPWEEIWANAEYAMAPGNFLSMRDDIPSRSLAAAMGLEP